MANYWQKRTYAELSTEPGDLARRGFVYLVHRRFTLPASGSVYFVIETNGKPVEFQFYDITTTTTAVYAELVEGPTFSRASASIAAQNLNRNFPDTHTAMLYAASGVSGGLAIASELLGSTAKAGGQVSQDKVHTLKNDEDYVMMFANLANQQTVCHINLGWAEGDPVPYALVTEGINSGGVT